MSTGSKYSPKIVDHWAEGTVLQWPTVSGEIAKIPCVYIYIKLDPLDRLIHTCEVEVKEGWYAFFDSGGLFRYDVYRKENLHLGRYQIDLIDRKVQFVIPVWVAGTSFAGGGWLPKKAELKDESLNLVVRGEQNQEKLEAIVRMSINVKLLLNNIKWQDPWLEREPALVAKSKEIMQNYASSLP